MTSYAIGSNGEEVPHGPAMALYLLAYERRKGWYYGAGTPSSSLMIKKELLLKVGGFDNTLRRVEDVDLAVRLALANCYFVGSPEILVERHMTQSGYKSADNNLIAEQHLVQKHSKFLLKRGLFYHAYHWPKLRYLHFKKDYLQFMLTLLGLFIRNPIKTLLHLGATGPKRLIHEKKTNP